jgi:hypothetical protein
MMNLLDGRVFIGTCSSESERLQQPIKTGQTEKIDCRRAKRQRSASDRIKHPGGEDNRHARFGLDNGDLSSRSPFGVKLPDFAAIQRVPAVTNLYFLADMGRMAPQLPFRERIVCSPAVTKAESTGLAWHHWLKPANSMALTRRSILRTC